MGVGNVGWSRGPALKVKKLALIRSFHTSLSAGNEKSADAVSLSQILKPSALWDCEMLDVNLRLRASCSPT